MLTDRFERLWSRLTSRWIAYQDAPRSPSGVRELAKARADLDGVRAEMFVERQRIRGQAPPPSEAGSQIAVSRDDIAKLGVQVFPQG